MGFKDVQWFRHQRGVGMTGIMTIIVVSLFLGVFAFRVVPHYLENWTISEIAEGVAANEKLLKKSRSTVYQHIDQAYRTNSLWGVKAEDTIELEKDAKKGYIMTVKYEKRATLFHNIDVVTSFNKPVNAEM
ncbi:MAG: DUF4845 domain-containing protein [Granulosicoccus sp.]